MNALGRFTYPRGGYGRRLQRNDRFRSVRSDHHELPHQIRRASRFISDPRARTRFVHSRVARAGARLRLRRLFSRFVLGVRRRIESRHFARSP